MHTIGIDIGFGFTKVSDGRNHALFKSVIGDPADIQFREQLLGDDAGAHRHIALDDDEFFVGDLAETQSRGRTFTLDQEQLIKRSARVLALAAMAPLVRDDEPIKLVTGLPIRYYRQHKASISNVLRQRHTFGLIDPNGQRRNVTLNVTDLRVIPQPFGSVFNQLLNDVGKVGAPALAKQKIGVIDVGFRTADYTICDKTRYSERGSQSADTGISRAFQAIAAALQEKSGINIELYRLFDAVREGSIKIRGRTFDLQKITQHAFERLAASIASDVNQLWADDWDMDAIIITGGGGRVLAPMLKPLLEGNVLDDSDEADPRLNNVKGYCKYGRYVWQN